MERKLQRLSPATRESRWDKIFPLVSNVIFVERELLTTFREVLEENSEETRGISYDVLEDTLLDGDKNPDHKKMVGIRLIGVDSLEKYDWFWGEIRKLRNPRKRLKGSD